MGLRNLQFGRIFLARVNLSADGYTGVPVEKHVFKEMFERNTSLLQFLPQIVLPVIQNF